MAAFMAEFMVLVTKPLSLFLGPGVSAAFRRNTQWRTQAATT